MTKKQLLSVLTATTVALLTTSLAYADETPVPVDPTAPSTEVVTPAPAQPEKLPDTSKPAEPETPKKNDQLLWIRPPHQLVKKTNQKRQVYLKHLKRKQSLKKK